MIAAARRTTRRSPARPRTTSAPSGLRPELAAAAGYLGLREPDLRARLLAGATLRELARERGRPLERLVQTMIDVGRAQLQAAVVAGLLTQAQLEDIVHDLRHRIEDSADCAIPFPTAFPTTAR